MRDCDLDNTAERIGSGSEVSRAGRHLVGQPLL